MLRYNILCRQAKAGGGIPGGVAQLGERLTGSQEVMGSIPTVSTNQEKASVQDAFLFCLPQRKSRSPARLSGHAGLLLC